MLNRMPSMFLTLGALALGVVIAYINHVLERYGILNSEDLGWKLINRMGWWWWGIPVVASAFGLYYMMRLDRPRSPLGWGARIGAMTGSVLYLFSWGNTSMGAFSAVITVVSFVAVIKQQAEACAAARKDRPDYAGQSWLLRFYTSLTTDMDDKVSG